MFITQQMNQSEDGPFSMFTIQKTLCHCSPTWPGRYLTSAHSYPFTADKLKAKSSIGVFLSMDLSIFGQNLEYRWNPGSPLKDWVLLCLWTRRQTREHSDVGNVLSRIQSSEKFIYSQRWTKTLCWLLKGYFDNDIYSYAVEKMEEYRHC